MTPFSHFNAYFLLITAEYANPGFLRQGSIDPPRNPQEVMTEMGEQESFFVHIAFFRVSLLPASI